MKPARVAPSHPRCSVCVDGSGQLLEVDGRTFRYSTEARTIAAGCSVRICRHCAPTSGAWNARSLQAEDLEPDRQAPAGMRIADLRDRKPRPVVTRASIIRRLWMEGRVRVAIPHRGRQRYRKPWRWVWCDLSLAEIAHLVGCSKQAVHKVITRWVSATLYRR